MGKQTPLYQAHQQANGKIVDFAGWDMPLNYGSQIQEHQAVRQDAGLFDVSHMTIVDITGSDAAPFLRYLLANDIAKLTTSGKALYTCMLNPQGGVIDDLLAYFIDPTHYRIIVNSSTRETDLAWLQQQSTDFTVTIQERPELAMLAIQGPQAREKAAIAMPEQQAQAASALKPFHSCEIDGWFIARTGYTGEDGFEIALPAEQAAAFWQALINTNITPCGLGARDTLRLEAGLNLYGIDMDTQTTPLESNLAWTVAWTPDDRDFIGRVALTQQREQGIKHQLVGLVLQDRGVLRGGQSVIIDGITDEGTITSGSFSPSLQQSIAFARIPVTEQQQCQVRIRNKLLATRIVKPVFVRNGKPLI